MNYIFWTRKRQVEKIYFCFSFRKTKQIQKFCWVIVLFTFHCDFFTFLIIFTFWTISFELDREKCDFFFLITSIFRTKENGLKFSMSRPRITFRDLKTFQIFVILYLNYPCHRKSWNIIPTFLNVICRFDREKYKNYIFFRFQYKKKKNQLKNPSNCCISILIYRVERFTLKNMNWFFAVLYFLLLWFYILNNLHDRKRWKVNYPF